MDGNTRRGTFDDETCQETFPVRAHKDQGDILFLCKADDLVSWPASADMILYGEPVAVKFFYDLLQILGRLLYIEFHLILRLPFLSPFVTTWIT